MMARVSPSVKNGVVVGASSGRRRGGLGLAEAGLLAALGPDVGVGVVLAYEEEGAPAGFDSVGLTDMADRGKDAKSLAVPAVTWLALRALSLFPTVGEHSAGVHDLERDRRYLVWPLWRQPLGLAAIQALLLHPDVAAAARREKKAVSQLAASGITAVCASERSSRPGGYYEVFTSPEVEELSRP